MDYAGAGRSRREPLQNICRIVQKQLARHSALTYTDSTMAKRAAQIGTTVGSSRVAFRRAATFPVNPVQPRIFSIVREKYRFGTKKIK